MVVSSNACELRVMAATLEDDETPPDLVDVAAMPEQPVSVEEEQTVRVPITLVTGMLPRARIGMEVLTRLF